MSSASNTSSDEPAITVLFSDDLPREYLYSTMDRELVIHVDIPPQRVEYIIASVQAACGARVVRRSRPA